jgi:hypothetical protein
MFASMFLTYITFIFKNSCGFIHQIIIHPDEKNVNYGLCHSVYFSDCLVSESVYFICAVQCYQNWTGDQTG